MNSQFKKGIIEMCVMGLISQKDMYGFEVIEAMAKEFDVNENTVYPILRRLTAQNYFDTYLETTGIAAPRKYYTITKEGSQRMNEYREEWTTFLQGVFNIIGGNHNER
ncbi:MAG: PadR family transcriptional regulator [Firmicutes bacterium]|nr:PadR family transcriptional regulator [Bacillota bacterium]